MVNFGGSVWPSGQEYSAVQFLFIRPFGFHSMFKTQQEDISLPIHDLFVPKQNNKKVKISFFSSPSIPKSFKVKPQLKDVVLELASEILKTLLFWTKSYI